MKAKNVKHLFFHVFIRCNKASYFNICKIFTWKTYKSYPEVTHKFINLGDLPSNESVELESPITERFTALMSQRITNATTIDEPHHEMCIKDKKDLKTIPPTAASLQKHVFCAAYINGLVRNNAFSSSPDLPQPNE